MASGPRSSNPFSPSSPFWLCLALAVVAGNLFCVLAVVVGRHGAPLPLDESIHRWLLAHRTTALTDAAIAVTTSGTGPVAYLLAALAGLLAANGLKLPAGGQDASPGRSDAASGRTDATVERPLSASGRRYWQSAVAALLALLALGLGQLVRSRLAAWIDRPRPPMADWAWHALGPAFPSGHATTSALVAGLFVLACNRTSDGRRRYRAVPVVAVLWAAAVGLTRIYLGVHWPTDVAAGWLLAAALTLTASSLAVAFRRR